MTHGEQQTQSEQSTGGQEQEPTMGLVTRGCSPRPWVERGLGNISAQVLAPPKRMGILSLLQIQHFNSATQCRTLKVTFKIPEYLIFYLEKCSKFYNSGWETEKDIEKQNKKFRLRGRSCSEGSFGSVVSF